MQYGLLDCSFTMTDLKSYSIVRLFERTDDENCPVYKKIRGTSLSTRRISTYLHLCVMSVLTPVNMKKAPSQSQWSHEADSCVQA